MDSPRIQSRVPSAIPSSASPARPATTAASTRPDRSARATPALIAAAIPFSFYYVHINYLPLDLILDRLVGRLGF